MTSQPVLRHKTWSLLFIFIAVISFFHLYAQKLDRMDLDRLHKRAQFSRIADILKNSGFENLSTQDKLLYIECLARTARRDEAERLLQKTLADNVHSHQAHVTAGIVQTSRGQFMEAEYHLEQALLSEQEGFEALMALIMLKLYQQKYRKAQEIHEEIAKGNPEWAESYLFHLLGLEVYGAVGDIAKIAELYKLQANRFKKVDNKQHQNFQKNARLYRKESQKKAFQSKTSNDRVALPFVEQMNGKSYVGISLNINGNSYYILLDTGNRVGWTIHSRDLEKRLKHRGGGLILTQIGTEEGMIHGHLLLTKRVEFRDLTLNQMPGMFVAKPNQNYPDANLNPLFIKDRVVSLDFINKKMLLRTKERFQDDLAKVTSQSEKAVMLPWYGHEQAFIPVEINNTHKALALIETGAEDITVNQDFALGHRLSMEPMIKYLPTGEELPYHKTPIQLNMGHVVIERRTADVWFLERLADPITGFMPDVLLGPDLFDGRFVLTFDPYQKTILITEFSF